MSEILISQGQWDELIGRLDRIESALARKTKPGRGPGSGNPVPRSVRVQLSAELGRKPSYVTAVLNNTTAGQKAHPSFIQALAIAMRRHGWNWNVLGDVPTLLPVSLPRPELFLHRPTGEQK